jgi:ComF family protein
MLIKTTCLFCQIDLALELGGCEFCYSRLPWIDKIKYRCNKCEKALTFEEQNKQLSLCYHCQETVTDFNKIFTIFAYQDPIKKLILDLKFKQKLVYGDFLGKILSKFVIDNWYQYHTLPAAVIPVPLHEDRLRSRGFNQAFELSKHITKVTKIKINNTACVRTKNTINQASLLKAKRSINIKHAFVATRLPYKHIAILDDVVTTSGTIKSLCKAIRQQNSNIIIDVWCICRA